MEQSFSKVDRCFDSGRFGPKSADTERRCVSVLTMAENSEQTILQGARRLFAGAVKKYTGPQRRKRMDSGIKKEKKKSSETTFLLRKRKAVAEAIHSLPASSRRLAGPEDTTPLSDKASKELALQKKRKFDKAVMASQNGYLLPEDEGPEPFAKAAAQREVQAQQDQKRIEAQAARTSNCKRLCEAQLWNWRSLGARKAWCSGLAPDRGFCYPLQLVQASCLQYISGSSMTQWCSYLTYFHTKDPRQASVFIADSDVISEKIYLLAMAQGGCVLSKAVLHGKPGLKMEYQGQVFRRLGQQHVGVHCSKAFRDEHPAFVKVLAWVLQKGGWRKLKETSLDKKKSITLLALQDPDAKQLKSKSWKTFVDKSAFVQYLTEKCEVKEKSFPVASAL